MKTRLMLVAMLFAVAMIALGAGQVAEAKGTKTRITLAAGSSFPGAKGKATYKSDGSEREFQVEVENIKSLAGTSLKVYVNGAQVGSAKVNGLGEARLNLNTDSGNAVPQVAAGTKVRVTTSAGTLVVSGKF